MIHVDGRNGWLGSGQRTCSEDMNFEVIHSEMNFFRKMLWSEKRNENSGVIKIEREKKTVS